MRILHIVGTINPAAGGPTEAIKMLVQYAPAGYTAELATLDDPSAPFLQDLPFLVHPLGGPGKRWYAPMFLPWLRAHRDDFDGVIVHGLWEYTGLGAMRAFAGRVPYLVFAHGMLDPWFKRTFPAKHLKKWLYWIPAEYWVLRRAYRVLFTTALERDLATQSFALYRVHPMVMPLGAERPPSNPEILRQAFYARCPAVQGRRFLLFLGRLHPKKGCDLLIQAFGVAAADDPDLDLVMAGPDPRNWRAQLEALLPDDALRHRVHWPGMLRDEAKWGAFAACDAFVLPSHQENFGIAAVEALASGKAVLLAEPVNIAPDMAAAGCALVEPDTLEGTARLLHRWTALSGEDRRRMEAQARTTFERCYDMRRNTATILRLFESAGTSTSERYAPTLEVK